jgi:hypothetical protein
MGSNVTRSASVARIKDSGEKTMAAATARGGEVLDLAQRPNHLAYSCEVLRRIQGVVKTTAERTETSSGQVRCSSDHPTRPVHGFVFALQCPERLSAIEYQLAPGGPWRTAAISPGHAENVGFVEIAAE